MNSKLAIGTGLAVGMYSIGAFTSKFVAGDNLGVVSGLSLACYGGIFVILLLIWIEFRNGRLGRHLLGLILLVQSMFAMLGYMTGGVGATSPNFGQFLGYFYQVGLLGQSSIQTLAHQSPEVGGWPAATAYYYTFLTITGLGTPAAATSVLVTWQLFSYLLDTILVFLIIRTTLEDSPYLAYAGALVYIFGDYLVYPEFLDVGFSYTLVLFTILLVFSLMKGAKKWRVAAMIIIPTVILTNFFASVVVLAILIGYTLRTRKFEPLVIFAVVYVGWNAIGSPSMYTGYIQLLLTNIFNLRILAHALVQGSSAGTANHHLIALSQLGLALFFATWTLFSLALIAGRHDRFLLVPVLQLLIFPLLIAGIALLIGPGFGVNQIESLERAFVFAFPFLLVIICASLKPNRIGLLIMVLLVITPFSILTTYGGVTSSYITQVEIQGGLFLQDHEVGNTFVNLEPANFTAPLPAGSYQFTMGEIQFVWSLVKLNASLIKTGAYPHDNRIVGSIGSFESRIFLIYTGSPIQYSNTESAIHDEFSVVYSSQTLEYFIL